MSVKQRLRVGFIAFTWMNGSLMKATMKWRLWRRIAFVRRLLDKCFDILMRREKVGSKLEGSIWKDTLVQAKPF
ncbi:hypothetical protein D3C76_1247710 [compost metagenome]